MSTEYTLAELFAAFSNLAETNTKLLRQYDESAARIAVAGPMLIDLFGYDARHNTQRAELLERGNEILVRWWSFRQHGRRFE